MNGFVHSEVVFLFCSQSLQDHIDRALSLPIGAAHNFFVAYLPSVNGYVHSTLYFRRYASTNVCVLKGAVRYYFLPKIRRPPKRACTLPKLLTAKVTHSDRIGSQDSIHSLQLFYLCSLLTPASPTPPVCVFVNVCFSPCARRVEPL